MTEEVRRQATTEEAARGDELGGDAAVDRELLPHAAALRTERAGDDQQRPSWLVPLLAAAAALGLAVATTFGILYLRTEITPPEITDYLAAERPQIAERAERVATLLFNYDSTTLDQVAQQMLEISTGNFREQFEQALAAGGGLGTALEEASASSRGQLLDDPDVSFRSGAEAVATFGVRQTTQSNRNPGGRTFDYVLKITFVDTTDGGWKADRVAILSASEV